MLKKIIPARHVAAISVCVTCTCVALSNYRAIQPAVWVETPRATEFLTFFLELPGMFAGLPMIILGGLTEAEWVMQCGMILGATFFWYGVGCYVDCARGVAGLSVPPKLVRSYMSVLMGLSVIALPLAILIGIKGGHQYCGNFSSPYWAVTLTYGIVMFWTALGGFFAYRRFRERQKSHSSASGESRQTADRYL